MNHVRTNSGKAWLLAARPKTLTGAITPVLVGCALAYSDGQLQWTPAVLCLLFACLMQVAANFINDLFDFLKGSDREDRLGPERACAQGWITPQAMKGGIAIVLTAAGLTGCSLLYHGWHHLPYQGWELVLIGVGCMAFAFLYTTMLSYQGWGDLLVLVFFGLVPVCGTYYVQTYTLTLNVLLAATACGLAIDALLVVNNYRDRQQDAISGKRTLIVRYGEPFGRYLYLGTGVAAWGLTLSLTLTSKLSPGEAWIPTAYLLLHVLTWRKMVRIRSGKGLNAILGETSRNMLYFGLLLSAILVS